MVTTEWSANKYVPPSEVRKNVDMPQFDVRKTMKVFFEELSTLLHQYADPEADLVIDGRIIPAEQKFGGAATLLLQDKLSELEQSETTLLQIYDITFKLEKTLGQII